MSVPPQPCSSEVRRRRRLKTYFVAGARRAHRGRRCAQSSEGGFAPNLAGIGPAFWRAPASQVQHLMRWSRPRQTVRVARTLVRIRVVCVRPIPAKLEAGSQTSTLSAEMGRLRHFVGAGLSRSTGPRLRRIDRTWGHPARIWATLSPAGMSATRRSTPEPARLRKYIIPETPSNPEIEKISEFRHSLDSLVLPTTCLRAPATPQARLRPDIWATPLADFALREPTCYEIGASLHRGGPEVVLSASGAEPDLAMTLLGLLGPGTRFLTGDVTAKPTVGFAQLRALCEADSGHVPATPPPHRASGASWRPGHSQGIWRPRW